MRAERRAAWAALALALAGCGEGAVGPAPATREARLATDVEPRSAPEVDAEWPGCPADRSTYEWQGTRTCAGPPRAGENPALSASGPYQAFDVDGAVRVVGTVEDGVQVGLSTHLAADGAVLAQGELEAGARAGDWWRWFPSGAARSVTGWVDGVREGPHVAWSEAGPVAALGQYAAGEPVGLWQTAWPDGALQREETFVAGVLDGPWAAFHPDGQPAEAGDYVAGRKDGVWQTWHPDGTPACELGYADGLQDGPSRCADASGQPVFEEAWVAGRRHGESRTWSPHWLTFETVRVEGQYVDGVLVGETVAYWDATDAVAGRFRYQQGDLQGPFEEFWPDGTLLREGHYLGGGLHYEARTYFEDGALWIQATWVRNQLVGPYQEWWPNGQLRARGTMDRGVPHDDFEYWDEAGNPVTP